MALLGLAGLILATLGSLAGPAVAAKPTKPSGSTTTAQSIWTDFKSSGSDSSFGYTDTETWAFSDTAAADYYVLTVGTVSYSCNGSPTNCADPGNKPVAPQTPGATEIPLNVPNADECKFWSGNGALTTTTGTYSETIAGINGSGNWKFEWDYTWADKGLTRPAKAAWSISDSNSPGGANVTFTGQIAGLSVMSSNKTDRKYSFSLLNSDGTARVTNVLVAVDGGAGIPVASSVVNALSEAFADFSIGADGDLSTLLKSSGTVSLLAEGDARTILNNDSFSGNQNGGSSGDALAYAQLSAVRLLLTEGAHSVVLSATVKDLNGGADVSVSVSRSLRIQGLGSCA